MPSQGSPSPHAPSLPSHLMTGSLGPLDLWVASTHNTTSSLLIPRFSQGSSERQTNRMCVCVKRFIIRILLLWSWRLVNSKSVDWASRLETQESWCFSSSLKAICWRILSLFVLARPSTRWSLPTLWRATCYTQIAWLNANFIPKQPYRNILNVWLNICAACGAASWHIKFTITLLFAFCHLPTAYLMF